MKTKYPLTLLTLGTFAIIGTALLSHSFAARADDKVIESEDSTLQGPVATASDINASNGQYIEFSHSEDCNCSYATSRLLGYIWGDGSFNENTGKWFFRSKSNAIVSHMQAILAELNIVYTSGTSPQGHTTFNMMLPELSSTFLEDDPNLNEAINCDLEAFLASVIEGEGSKSGLVMDDPLPARRNGIATLLTELGFSPTITNQKVNVPQDDWPLLDTVPFVACGRVPGGNCVLGQTGGTQCTAATSFSKSTS